MIDEHSRSRAWMIVALCLLLVAAGYLVTQWLFPPPQPFRGAAPEQPAVPLIAPVAQPEIRKYEEIARYTEGKPVPAAPPFDVYFVPDDEERHVRGDPATPVRLVEYAGLANPYAQVMHAKLAELLARNAGRMHWALRHYPRTGNEDDYRAAQATECLAKQLGEEAFFRYVDVLLSDVGSTLPMSDLKARAAELGADADALQNCVESKSFWNLMMDDKRTANVDTKIFVSPAFVFYNLRTHNMRVVEGANTLEYMQAVLEEVER